MLRVIWLRYWIRPDAVLLSSQLQTEHKETFIQMNKQTDRQTHARTWRRNKRKGWIRTVAVRYPLKIKHCFTFKHSFGSFLKSYFTYPSGRSLSNRRLQSTTGPPVPILSLDWRLTVDTQKKQKNRLLDGSHLWKVCVSWIDWDWCDSHVKMSAFCHFGLVWHSCQSLNWQPRGCRFDTHKRKSL